MREWLRRPVVLGTLAAVVTAAIGVVAVLLVAAALESDDASAARTPQVTTAAGGTRDDGRGTTTTSRPRSTTTTTGAGGTLPATGGAPAAGTPGPDPADEADDAPDPPDPRNAFQPGTVAPGISVSISSCTWSPTAGGTLRATGSMSYSGTEDTFWDLEISWIVNNQGQDEELDSQSDVYDLVNGQTISWTLTTTTEQPTPPPNLSCTYAVR